MPMISFTKKDFGPPSAGWHLFTVKSCEEKANKAKNGTNYVYELEPTKEPDRKITLWVPTKQPEVKAEFYEAVTEQQKQIGENIDVDPLKLTGLQFYGQVEHRIATEGPYAGKKQAEIVAFSPKSAPPF